MAFIAVVAMSCEVADNDVELSPDWNGSTPDNGEDDGEYTDPVERNPTTPIKRRPIVPSTQLPRPRIIGYNVVSYSALEE